MALPNRWRACWFSGLCLLAQIGCATKPYQYSRFHPAGTEPDEVVMEFGKPHKVIDGIGWVVGLPDRILPLNSKINNHRISPETTEKLAEFLEKNDLNDVFISVNQYAPCDQWRRLRENQRISAGWRYSMGTLTVVAYTVLPGRIFGGDYYNPFTNSLYLNSDVTAIVLCEAAYAKDVYSRKYPGAYAAINEFPLLSLWHKTIAVSDILGYAQAEDDWQIEKETYHVVYPFIAAHGASIADPFVPTLVSPIIWLGGAAVGHTVGRTLAARRDHELHDGPPSEDGDSPEGRIQLTDYVEEQMPKPAGSRSGTEEIQDEELPGASDRGTESLIGGGVDCGAR